MAEPAWLTAARAQLGKPYIWGSAGGRSTFADSAPGFDCSGFVSYVYKSALGVDIPAFTGNAYPRTQAVDRSGAKPGDLVFWNMNQGDPRRQHVALYIGGGKVIQSGGAGNGVNIASIDQMPGAEVRRAAPAQEPLRQQALVAGWSSSDMPDTPGLNTPGGPIGPPGAPAAPSSGTPGGPDDKRDGAQRIRDALAALDTTLKGLTPADEWQRAALLSTQQALLTSLTAAERAGPGGRDDAAKALDAAQAAAQAAGIDLRRGELEVARERVAAEQASAAADRTSRERIAAGGNQTDLAVVGAQGANSLAVTNAQGANSLAVQGSANTSAERIATQRDVLERARLEWEGAQKKIEQALAERKVTLDEAIAAATEARERIGLQLQAQQNQIAATQGDISQRGQDLTAGVTQRGQDLEAQTAVRGQDIGRLNQATQSGAALLGAAQGAAGQIGAATGSTANAALARYGPANSAETFNQASAGATDYQLGSTPMPFDPLTIVQTAADAAYARFAPPGQALLAQGAAPSPGFVAPGQIAAPARVANPYQPLELPPSRFTAPAAQPTA